MLSVLRLEDDAFFTCIFVCFFNIWFDPLLRILGLEFCLRSYNDKSISFILYLRLEFEDAFNFNMGGSLLAEWPRKYGLLYISYGND